MNFKRLAQLHTLIAQEFDLADSGEPNQPDPVQPTPEPTPQPPETGKMPVRILFYGKNHSYKPPIDIMINGVWYDFSVAMDVKFRINQAVGTLIHVDTPITNIALAKRQIHNPNLNENGFGWTNIKYGAVPAADDMLNVNDSFWSRWVNGKGNHTAHWGDLNRSTPDPEFFRMNVPKEFNDTGKFAIYVSGYGENRP